MAENNAVVGVHNSNAEAEASIKELQRSCSSAQPSYVVRVQQRLAA